MSTGDELLAEFERRQYKKKIERLNHAWIEAMQLAKEAEDRGYNLHVVADYIKQLYEQSSMDAPEVIRVVHNKILAGERIE